VRDDVLGATSGKQRPYVSASVARFEYTYLVRNNAEERSGRAMSEFTVRRLTTHFEIVAETGETLSRAVRKLK